MKDKFVVNQIIIPMEAYQSESYTIIRSNHNEHLAFVLSINSDSSLCMYMITDHNDYCKPQFIQDSVKLFFNEPS